MFERYTEAARRAVYFANREAVHRDESAISVKDILLGLTWDEGERADRLASLKDRAVALRALVEVPHLPSTAFPYRRKKEIPLDEDSKRIIRYAGSEADDDGQYWIDTDHLLRGILRFPNAAAEALKSEGLTVEQVRAAAAADRQKFPPHRSPRFAKLSLLFERYGRHAGWVLLVLVLIILLASLLRT